VIDLHTHTTASDGEYAPAGLVDRAAAAGLTVLAVTDHDTTAGLDEAEATALAHGIRLVPGIEITSVLEGRDVHVLGYFFERASAALQSFLAEQRQERIGRARAMAARLARAGAPIDIEAVLGRAPVSGGRAVGRPQIARALVEAGCVSSMQEAFERFLGEDCCAYVPHTGASPAEAIAVIRDAGGIASLAHPGLLGRDEMIADLAEAGLGALEAMHSDHDPAQEAWYLELAGELGLAVSGGSDYHGEGFRRARRLGGIALPPEHFELLCERVLP
jgi:predicted metal-dependent phosphoesterase TrpH